MFRTELSVSPSQGTIGLKDPIFTIGSCFSDAIGRQFAVNKFNILANPFGTIYNPVSIFKLLDYCLEDSGPNQDTFIIRDGLYLNYDFHSFFTAQSESELKGQLVQKIKNTRAYLKQTKYLIITLGTAYVYELRANKEIVANCHKQPQELFTKRLLTQKEIVARFQKCYDNLMQNQSDTQIILTVSPVRHLKDSIEGNSVSKSILRLTCHTLSEQLQNVNYFPSYELLLDDLRDYRFFKKDMIHPSEEAEEYIWEKFQQSYVDSSLQNFIAKWKKLRTAIHHKAFNPTSEKHQKFLKDTVKKISELNRDVDFSYEIELLKKQIL